MEAPVCSRIVEPIVFATWALALATALLVVISWLQWLNGKREADTRGKRAEEELGVLREQAKALSDQADANRRVAEEMLVARRAANPLELDLEQTEQSANQASFRLRSLRAGAIVHRIEGLLDSRQEVAWSNNYENAYLGGESVLLIQETFPSDRGDRLVVRVTGTPTNGVSQTHEFQFRIDRERHLQPIDPPSTLVVVRLSSSPNDDSLVIKVVNRARGPIQIDRAGFASERVAEPQSWGPLRAWLEHHVPWPATVMASGGTATRPAPPPPLPAMIPAGGSIEVAARIHSVAQQIPNACWAFVQDAWGVVHWTPFPEKVQTVVDQLTREIAHAGEH